MRIDTRTGRSRLKSRKEPYWLKLRTGAHLGYRKTKDSGYWIARFRYRDSSGAYCRPYHSLGEISAMDFDEAVAAAEEWFSVLRNPGAVRAKRGTVAHACEAYAAELEAEGREDTAKDARDRFKQLVNKDELGGIDTSALTRDDVISWRNRIRTDKRGPAAVNRHLRTLKAALNKCTELGYAANPVAWQSVKQFSNAESRREIFLNAKQRTALIDAAEPDLQAFIKGLLLTAARPGELGRATVTDFDPRQGNVTLRSAKGRDGIIKARSVPLTPAGVQLFKNVAKDKIQKAPLFTRADGGAWDKTPLSRAIRATVKRANKKKAETVPAGTCGYTCRHTAISEWLSAGIDGVTVAKLSGTSVLMIEKHYHKFIRQPAIDKLSGIKLI